MLEVNPVSDADQRRERRQPLCEGATFLGFAPAARDGLDEQREGVV